MRKRIILAMLLGPAVAFSQVGVASADTALVTANITAGGIGLRSITSVPAIVLSAALEDSTVSGSMTTIVSEAAVTGDNSWTVTAALTSLTKGTDTLANSYVDLSSRATSKLLGGGTVTDLSGEDPVDMSATRTLMENTGQSPLTVYTGTYTTTANLDLEVPNGTATGVYTGTMTVTLVQ